jgi:hypothetical protein
VGDSTPRPEVDAYFSAKFAGTRSQGWSYGGYDKNRLFLNLGGERFVDIAHVLGLAVESDCRNVLADDFDGDGDQDLLVTTFEVWPALKQTVRFLDNNLPRSGHWIEIQPRSPRSTLRHRHHRPSPGQGRAAGANPGHRGRVPFPQAGLVASFGLGEVTEVEQVEVHWPGGLISRTNRLASDRRHILTPARSMNRAHVAGGRPAPRNPRFMVPIGVPFLENAPLHAPPTSDRR